MVGTATRHRIESNSIVSIHKMCDHSFENIQLNGAHLFSFSHSMNVYICDAIVRCHRRRNAPPLAVYRMSDAYWISRLGKWARVQKVKISCHVIYHVHDYYYCMAACAQRNAYTNGKANFLAMMMKWIFVHGMKNLLINLLMNVELNTVCASVNKIQMIMNLRTWQMVGSGAIHRHTEQWTRSPRFIYQFVNADSFRFPFENAHFYSNRILKGKTFTAPCLIAVWMRALNA